MKRTRQRFDRPAQDAPDYTSGCCQFEGEDLLHNERLAMQAQQMREWIAQQSNEHQQQN